MSNVTPSPQDDLYQYLSAGKVLGYFLSTYSARKLGMKTTGNAGGSHNLLLRSRQTLPDDDLAAMLELTERP